MDTMDGLAKNMEEPAQRLTQQLHRCLPRDCYFQLLKSHFLFMDLLNDTLNPKNYPLGLIHNIQPSNWCQHMLAT